MSKCSASVGSKKYVSYNTGIFTRKPKRDHPAPQLIFRPIKRPLRTELPAFRNIPPHPAAGKAEAIYSTYPQPRIVPDTFRSAPARRERFLPGGAVFKPRHSLLTVYAPARRKTSNRFRHPIRPSAGRSVFLHQARLNETPCPTPFLPQRFPNGFSASSPS